MIQRIQSILLFISAITTACFLFVFPYYITKDETVVLAMDNSILLGLGILSLILSIVTIFLFKDRKKQMLLCMINKGVILASCAMVIYSMYEIQETIKANGFGVYFIAISYIFVAFARKYIKKDQDLIESVDRIR